MDDLSSLHHSWECESWLIRKRFSNIFDYYNVQLSFWSHKIIFLWNQKFLLGGTRPHFYLFVVKLMDAKFIFRYDRKMRYLVTRYKSDTPKYKYTSSMTMVC